MASFPKQRSATAIGNPTNAADARAAEAAKTARLRALRLAKEADDREAGKTATPAVANPTRSARPSSSVRRRQKSTSRE
jgi:hypothetical protein